MTTQTPPEVPELCEILFSTGPASAQEFLDSVASCTVCKGKGQNVHGDPCTACVLAGGETVLVVADEKQVSDLEQRRREIALEFSAALTLARFWGVVAIRTLDEKLRADAVKKLNKALRIIRNWETTR